MTTSTTLDNEILPNIPREMDLYSRDAAPNIPYTIPVHYTFTQKECTELEQVLNVRSNPYREFNNFQKEIRAIVRDDLPGSLANLREAIATFDERKCPVFYLKNCPTGEVPYLDFENPVDSKYERKKSFISEAFLSIFAELRNTTIITYRTANNGDMFHDVHPLKDLQYTMSQKTATTLHFHTDLPDNRLRPDWVNILTMRNSPKNEVYTAFVRLLDVFELEPELLKMLRKPLFENPRTKVKNNISVYGLQEAGYIEAKPVAVTERGYEFFRYNETYTISRSPEGQRALRALSEKLQQLRCSIFLEKGDFVSVCNNTCVHARHVVKIRDLEAHRNRWLLKTWNIDDPTRHSEHFLPGHPNTVDE